MIYPEEDPLCREGAGDQGKKKVRRQLGCLVHTEDGRGPGARVGAG